MLKSLPDLGSIDDGGFEKAFDYNATVRKESGVPPIGERIIEPGTILPQAQHLKQPHPGSWFFRTAPASPADAEVHANLLEYGKEAEVLKFYVVVKPVRAYVGPIKDGQDMQFLIPNSHMHKDPTKIPEVFKSLELDQMIKEIKFGE